MMHKKSWMIPITVLLLCSYLLINYQESNPSSAYAVTLPAIPMPIDYTVSDIIGIQVTWPNQTITAHRTERNWTLSEPLTTRADVSFIYDMIQGFVSPGNLIPVDEPITHLRDFGITDKSLTVRLEDHSHTLYEFVQGNMTPTGDYYVYIPSCESMYTVPATTFEKISYNPLDWYDKDYLQFDPTTTTQITLYNKGVLHTMTPVQMGDTTHFVSPTLSEQEVATCISFLSTSRAINYIVDDASPQVIANYGLADPPLRITLDDDKGSRTFYLRAIGSDSNLYYIRLEATGTILAILPLIKS